MFYKNSFIIATFLYYYVLIFNIFYLLLRDLSSILRNYSYSSARQYQFRNNFKFEGVILKIEVFTIVIV